MKSFHTREAVSKKNTSIEVIYEKKEELKQFRKESKMEKLKIEYIDIEKLIPYINNPRINDNAVDLVAASIKEFGFKNPILIDKENVIIAGHTRLKAAKKLGLKEVPVIRVEDLTDKQIKAFRIADNKTADFADWDMELLELELEELEDIFTGFSEEEKEVIFNASNVDIDSFFEDAEETNKEKEEKEIQCPHCGMYFKP